MATNPGQARIAALKKLQKARTASTLSSSDKMANQIGNYETRLGALGQKKGTRNPLEKFLGLPEGQNVLFDIFDIIGRPQQALFGAVESAQQGENPLIGLKEGFVGEKQTYGGELLRNAGMEDQKLFSAFGNDVSASDIAGGVLDVFGDPVDIALWASTVPTGGATAPIAAANTLGDLTKAGKTLKLADKAVDTAQIASKVAKGAKVADATSDIAKGTKIASGLGDLKKLTPLELMVKGDNALDVSKFVKGAKPITQTVRKSTLEKGAEYIGKGIKKTGKAADTLLTSGLGKVDTKSLDNIVNNLNKAGVKVTKDMPVDDIIKTAKNAGIEVATKDFSDLASNYGAMKKSITNAIDYSKSLPGNVINKVNRGKNTVDFAVARSKNVVDNLEKEARTYLDNAISKGMKVDNYDNALNNISRQINNVIESDLPSQVSAYDFLKRGRDGKAFKGSADEVKRLTDYIEKAYPGIILKSKLENGVNTLSISTKKSKGLNDLLKNPNEVSKLKKELFTKDLGASEKTLKEIEILKQNPEFMKLVDNSKQAYNDIAKYMSEATGGKVSFEDITNLPGYTTRVKNPELVTTGTGTGKSLGSAKAFSGRKTEGMAETINEQADAVRKQKIVNKQKTIKKTRKQFYENIKPNLESQVKGLTNKIEETTKKVNSNLAKADIKLKEVTDLRNTRQLTLDNITNKLTDDIIEKASKASNTKISDNLIKGIDNLSNKQSEFIKIQNRLTQDNLTKSDIKSLYKQSLKINDDIMKQSKKLEVAIAEANNAVDDLVLKNIKKASDKLDDAINLKNKIYKNENVIKKLEIAKKELSQNSTSYINKLENTKKGLEIKLGALGKNYDKVLLEQIGQLERDIDILNSDMGKQLLNNSFFDSIGTFVDKTAKDTKALATFNETLLSSTINNDTYIKFLDPNVSKGKVPSGFTELKKQDAVEIAKKLDGLKYVIPDKTKVIKNFKKIVNKSDGMYIDKNVLNLIQPNFNNNEVKGFMNVLNSFNNTFKKYKTLTPGFHIRNVSGNMSNLVLSGTNMYELPGLYKQASKLSDKSYIKDIIEKANKNILSKTEKNDLKIINQFIQGGFAGNGKEIQDLGEVVSKISQNKITGGTLTKIKSNTLDKIVEKSIGANEWIDNRSRLMILIKGNNDPKYLAKLGVKDPNDAVRFVAFDPKNLSPSEQKYMKKVMPFYTFAKQNLIFQANNMMKNTSKYNRLMKTFNGVYDGIGEDKYNQYQKEGFEVPLPFTDESGNIATLKTNLPFSDLGEYMSDPLRRLVSGANPLIKAPFEAVTGVDVFTGQPSTKSPLESILYNTGLDVISTAQLKKFEQLSDEDSNSYQKLTQLFPSVLRYADSEKIANSKMYNDLEEYQQMVKDLENQGIDVPTIKELTTTSQSSLNRLKNKRKKRNSY